MIDSMTQIHTSKTEKVTISLPRDLLEFADETAAERNTSRSHVVADLLAAERHRLRDVAAAEGYRFYSGEAREWAVVTAPAVAEVITHERETW